MTYTSRNDLEEADLLEDVFANPRLPPRLPPISTPLSAKKETRQVKALDLSKIADFAERMRARRLLNDILDQWAAFSSMSRNTREASLLSLQKTMASARRRILGSSLQTMQVVTARLTGFNATRLPPIEADLSVQSTHLVTIPYKTVYLTTSRTTTVEIDGSPHLALTAGLEKAVEDLIRLEKKLAN
jgi:hypothetical protein